MMLLKLTQSEMVIQPPYIMFGHEEARGERRSIREGGALPYRMSTV